METSQLGGVGGPGGVLGVGWGGGQASGLEPGRIGSPQGSCRAGEGWREAGRTVQGWPGPWLGPGWVRAEAGAGWGGGGAGEDWPGALAAGPERAQAAWLCPLWTDTEDGGAPGRRGQADPWRAAGHSGCTHPVARRPREAARGTGTHSGQQGWQPRDRGVCFPQRQGYRSHPNTRSGPRPPSVAALSPLAGFFLVTVCEIRQNLTFSFF